MYEGLTYKLSLAFPNDYPFKSPTVKFETPCFHPQRRPVWQHLPRHPEGEVERRVQRSDHPALIQSLLRRPTNQSPLNAQAAQLWENQEDYKKTLHKKYREDTANCASTRSARDTPFDVPL